MGACLVFVLPVVKKFKKSHACVCVCVSCVPKLKTSISMLPIVLASVLIAGGKNIWLSKNSLCHDESNCVLEDCCYFIKTERKSCFLDSLCSISRCHSLSPQPLDAVAHPLNP